MDVPARGTSPLQLDRAVYVELAREAPTVLQADERAVFASRRRLSAASNTPLALLELHRAVLRRSERSS